MHHLLARGSDVRYASASRAPFITGYRERQRMMVFHRVMRVALLAALGFVLGAPVLASAASITLYADRSSFLAATSETTSYDFEAQNPNSSVGGDAYYGA